MSGTARSRRGAGDRPVFPDLFVARIHGQLGSGAERCLAALAAPATGLRVNTLRIAPDELARIAPFAVRPVPFPPAGFTTAGDERPSRHPYHAAGLYYLQDPGAMTVGELLAPAPGERVLDLAAAPGGKTTHAAALMENRGVLVANDPHPSRARELVGNLERCGVRNAIVTVESVDRLADRFAGWFDRVLLDAPCSGEAMFSKSPTACESWSPATVAGSARRQAALLGSAARLVRPGGRLVYSTCTFAAEENEQVVASFLDDHPEFSTVALPEIPGGSPGEPGWAPASPRRNEISRTLRLWPHRFPGAGHFVAVLDRTAGGVSAEVALHPGGASDDAVRAWARFSSDRLIAPDFENLPLSLHGDALSALPAGAPDLSGLRIARTGVLLGFVRPGRFDPAHALAMAVAPETSVDRLSLAPDDPALHAYLRGETVPSDGPAGWILVVVDGYPLGWGKRVGSVVKNHRPKGLRSNA